MLTIGKRFEEAGAVTLSLAGKFSGGCIVELRRAMVREQRDGRDRYFACASD